MNDKSIDGFQSFDDLPVDPSSTSNQQDEISTKRNTSLPLTAIEEHYLKRELIRVQLNYELTVLSDFSQVGRLGPPFKPPTDTQSNGPDADTSMPILRHMFAHHIRTFPFFVAGLDKKGAPTSRAFWQDNLQKFLQVWGARDISSSEDREEATKRKRIGNKLVSLIAVYMSSGLVTTNPEEKDAKIPETGIKSSTKSGVRLGKGSSTAAKSGVQNIDPQSLARELSDAPNFINGFDINVVGVQMIHGKKSKKGTGLGNLGNLFTIANDHAEFIIRSRMGLPGDENGKSNSISIDEIPVVYVSRRFSDFRELDNKLSKEFTNIELPRFPTKNKKSTNLSSNDPKSPTLIPDDDISLDDDDDETLYTDSDSIQPSPTPKLSEPLPSSNFNFQQQFQNLSLNTKALFTKKQNASPTPTSPSIKQPKAPPSAQSLNLLQEKQRLSFRAYLRALISIPPIAKSLTLAEFFFQNQIRGDLSKEQQQDIARRRMMDIKRVEDQIEFLRLATARARELETHLVDFKRDLMEPNGLQNIFLELHTKASIEELSPRFRLFLEWACVEFAATLYSMFVASDSSADLFSQITRIHKLMPYSVLKGILRWSNPVAIMKGVIDLFLAQPFGKRSLLQNIFYMVLQEDIKTQDRQINAIKKCLDPKHAEIIVTVFDAYLRASPSVRDEIRLLAKPNGPGSFKEQEHIDTVVAIFQNARRLVPDGDPLQDEVALRVESWYEAWNNAVEKNKIETVELVEYQNEYISAYTATHNLLRLMMRRNDKDKLQALWNEPQTMNLIRELFTIFYSPLVELFKSAKVHEALGDFEDFMADLIRVVKRAEDSVLTRGPNEMVEEFVNLCNRHMPALYRFVHEMYLNDKGNLFDGVMKWLSDIIQFLRHGVLDPATTNANVFRHGSAFDSHNVVHREAPKLDLNKIVENAKRYDGVDPTLVVEEMDGLVAWLLKRRNWMKQQEAIAKEMTSGRVNRPNSMMGVGKDGMDWDAAMPMSDTIDGEVFGFAEHDLDTFEMLNHGEEDDDDDMMSTDIPFSPAKSHGVRTKDKPEKKTGMSRRLGKLRFGSRHTPSNGADSNFQTAGNGWQLSAVQQSAVEAERERRQQLLIRLEETKKMPQRPAIEESAKLRKQFAKELIKVLMIESK